MADDPIPAQLNPYLVDLEADKKYYWCRCGRSNKQPFCDGSHKGTGIEPIEFKVPKAGSFNLCGCKQTDDKPFCDGSHNLL